MGQHGSARLSVHSRRLIAVRVLDEGWSLTAAAQAAGVCRQTATKWLDRFVQEGEAGLRDRTCRPHRCRPMVPARVVAKIRRLRTRRLGSHAIAYWLGIARSTEGEPPQAHRHDHPHDDGCTYFELARVLRRAARRALKT